MAFEESKHPRAKDGKFAPKGSGTATGGAKQETKESRKSDYLDSLRKSIDEQQPNDKKELRQVYNEWAKKEHHGAGYEDEFRKIAKEYGFDDEDGDENNYDRASYIVNTIEDLDLSEEEIKKALNILKSDRASEFEKIIKDNLDIGDNAELAVLNALENYEDERKRAYKLFDLDF